MREVGGNKRLNAGSRGQGTEWVIGRLTWKSGPKLRATSGLGQKPSAPILS